MSDALSSDMMLYCLFSVQMSPNIGWTLRRSDSSIVTLISEAEALKVINHMSLILNGRKAFIPFMQ